MIFVLYVIRFNNCQCLYVKIVPKYISFDYRFCAQNQNMDCGSIQEEFSDLGIEVEDKVILDELDILSRRYNIDSGKISCEYFSFNSKNKLGTKPPTLETLAQFENEKLKNLRSQLGPRRPLDPIEGAENLPDCPDLGPGTPVRIMAAKRGVVTPESNPNKRCARFKFEFDVPLRN